MVPRNTRLGRLPCFFNQLHKNGKDHGKSFLMKRDLLAHRVSQQQYHLNPPRHHKIDLLQK
jgi:hypothetical protein